jgi:hypothetical protein
MAQVVESLCSKCKALSLNPSTVKRKKYIIVCYTQMYSSLNILSVLKITS